MNELVKLPQFGATMRVMAREMEKAGVIEEMMNDTLDDMDPEGTDEAADEEVNKVRWLLLSHIHPWFFVLALLAPAYHTAHTSAHASVLVASLAIVHMQRKCKYQT